ncbi:hypothetical protein Ppb6_01213 [Photorhabdus australis subsp. thailandensis]|uniref:Uncharacterized protein n=1 Tax=Photorhabdus australis subsp. thailandensis TaxID=2805096 RepID=A0A1C0U6N7_9GAMM|nr:hypothetical protein [Photorhabdus australis]OCQ53587.1 hypothetical protein Ppb6_01213 [Photorhabdus australis subsp. thailandensis]
MIFDDFYEAIENARFKKEKSGIDYNIIQFCNKFFVVGVIMPGVRVMFSTAYDGFHTVLPEVR